MIGQLAKVYADQLEQSLRDWLGLSIDLAATAQHCVSADAQRLSVRVRGYLPLHNFAVRLLNFRWKAYLAYLSAFKLRVAEPQWLDNFSLGILETRDIHV